MPNCLSGLASYPLDCREAAGIQDIYVRAWSGSVVYTYDSLGIITGSTTPLFLYEMGVRLETADYKPGEPNANSSAIAYTSNLSFELHKYQAILRNLMIAFGKAESEFFIRGQNGKIFIFGEENGALLQPGDGASLGKELVSMNGGLLKFQSKGQYPDREVSSAFFATATIL